MNSLDRRQFLATSSVAALAAATARGGESENPSAPIGKAEHCIFVWLGGGSSHLDTWDQKRKGDAKAKKPGSYYDPLDTAIPGVQICEHLERCAPILDRFNPVRTVHHDVIDEHALATNMMHTGRVISETVVYPSVGSVVAHERGAAGDGVPAYVLIGYPNVTRGPGFLGAKANYVYLTDTSTGPAGLSRPASVTAGRSARRERLLAALRADYRAAHSDDRRIMAYDQTLDEALSLAGPRFGSVFELDREPAELRNSYGGEFGQRCLLARRLIEVGTRFVEVSHNLNFVNGTGWDTHNEGQLNQHLLIRELDHALAGLVLDLEEKKLLDKTLIVVASEFGRPADFDGGGGRGHHSKAFTVTLAGGGLQNGKAIGTTDELGMSITERPVSVPDLHATIYAALGIDTTKELYAGDRPVPITDGGKPIAELFA
ncbi:MAG: DUF1501 domain-containing protein [Planctomycetota bacterium]|nr:DUF1501 domain-containing protein [Planctomycetaceae bacterium]MDQ3329271.1 DUF1501 domain-containing protein [Planctomycetota bacterium]